MIVIFVMCFFPAAFKRWCVRWAPIGPHLFSWPPVILISGRYQALAKLALPWCLGTQISYFSPALWFATMRTRLMTISTSIIFSHFLCRDIRQIILSLPTPVLLPGKSHGWRSLAGCSPWGHEESDTAERLHFHFSLSCIGEGNGNPLQCSCLENPRDGGAWWAAVYGVAQSWTRLKWLSSSSILSLFL